MRDALRNSHDKWPEPVRKRVEKNLNCKNYGKDDVESSHQVVKTFTLGRLQLCLGRNRDKVPDDKECDKILND